MKGTFLLAQTTHFATDSCFASDIKMFIFIFNWLFLYLWFCSAGASSFWHIWPQLPNHHCCAGKKTTICKNIQRKNQTSFKHRHRRNITRSYNSFSHPTPRIQLSVRLSPFFTCIVYSHIDRSHGLSGRRTKSSRPEGP